MEPKKKIGAGVILAIIFSSIIVLAMLGGVFYLLLPSGAGRSGKSMSGGNDFQGSGEFYDWHKNAAADPVSKQIPLDQFMEVNVNCTLFSVGIKRGDKYEVDYECIEGFEPDIKLDGKVLNINQTPSMNRIKDVDGDYICEMNIIIPQEAKLASAKIRTPGLNVHIRDVIIYTTDITTEYGNVVLANVESLSTKVNSNSGSISMESANMGESNLNTDSGSIVVRSSRFMSSDFNSDTGDVRVEGVVEPLSSYNMNLRSDRGKVTVESQEKGSSYTSTGGVYDLNISSGEGNIYVQ